MIDRIQIWFFAIEKEMKRLNLCIQLADNQYSVVPNFHVDEFF